MLFVKSKIRLIFAFIIVDKILYQDRRVMQISIKYLLFQANFSGIRDLKPVLGGHVYGKADLTVRSETALNGKTIEESASGHRVVNDDGHVSEFNIKPDETDLEKNLIELLLKMSGKLEDSSTKVQRT